MLRMPLAALDRGCASVSSLANRTSGRFDAALELIRDGNPLPDVTGRVCGFMPHPERHVDRTQHPRWTRGEGSEEGDGLRVFRNAVEYFR